MVYLCTAVCSAYRQQNRLHLALGEIGRIERSLFMLDWIENPELRMECQAGLNKGEARHTLARAVFAHSRGRIRDRPHDAQQKRVMALNLVIAAVVYWNTLYMDKATEHLRRQGRLPEPSLLRHVSPLGLGAHRPDRRLRLELRRRATHQRAASQSLSDEDPRVDPHRRVLPRRNSGYKPSDDARLRGNDVGAFGYTPWGISLPRKRESMQAGIQKVLLRES